MMEYTTRLMPHELLQDEMSELEVAVAFCHMALFSNSAQDAIELYAWPDVSVKGTQRSRASVTGVEAVKALREDVARDCEQIGESTTEYYLARGGLVAGRVTRPMRHRQTGEFFDLHRTDWVRVVDGRVADVELSYFMTAPVPVVAIPRRVA